MFVTCTHIVSFVCVIVLSRGVPGDDPMRGSKHVGLSYSECNLSHIKWNNKSAFVGWVLRTFVTLLYICALIRRSILPYILNLCVGWRWIEASCSLQVNPSAYFIGDTVGPGIGEKQVANIRFASFASNRAAVVQSVAIHCIDWALHVHFCRIRTLWCTKITRNGFVPEMNLTSFC
jgi:hypothetical protein